MAVLSGKLLRDLTHEYEVLNFSGTTEITLPNTAATGNGEWGSDDQSIDVYINGSLSHPGTDYSLDRATPNAHKLVFVNSQNGQDIIIKWTKL